MGDISDLADVERFSRSREGERVLKIFRDGLVGKRIAEVEYTHHAAGVGVTLILEDGDYLDLTEVQAAYAVETLRERYKRVLEREYYIDFPERKPGKSEQSDPPEIEQLHCPACGNGEAFAIETWQNLTFHRDGTVTEGDEGQQWDKNSPCRCDGCDHQGVVSEFLALDVP